MIRLLIPLDPFPSSALLPLLIAHEDEKTKSTWADI
jgi:hypothetical protein